MICKLVGFRAEQMADDRVRRTNRVAPRRTLNLKRYFNRTVTNGTIETRRDETCREISSRTFWINLNALILSFNQFVETDYHTRGEKPE